MAEIDKEANKFIVSNIDFQCVLIETGTNPNLYLEEYNGQEKANYWTENINNALVYQSLSEALPVYKHVAYKGNVEIKQITVKE